jgi:hypothetical protein
LAMVSIICAAACLLLVSERMASGTTKR